MSAKPCSLHPDHFKKVSFVSWKTEMWIVKIWFSQRRMKEKLENGQKSLKDFSVDEFVSWEGPPHCDPGHVINVKK